MVKDPVCGMEIEEKNAAGMSEYKGRTYYFCAKSCKDDFDKDPAGFIKDGTGKACPLPVPSVIQPEEIPAGSGRIDIPITGMTCASCASRIQNALSKLNGVKSAVVNFAAERATVFYNPSEASVDDFTGLIKDQGYGVSISRATIPIKGMTCASCVKKVQDSLLSLNGVFSATVNPATEKATVEYSASQAGMRDFKKAVRDAGYDIVEI